MPGARVAMFALSALSISSAAAQSQAGYPVRPVRIVVPYAPGGRTDINARNVAPKLNDLWRQSVVIDNRPGGNAMIGADIVAKAAPDGHTLVMALSGPFSINGSLLGKLPFDPLKDFALITLAGATPNLLVANPNAPFNSVRELLAFAKALRRSFEFRRPEGDTRLQVGVHLFKLPGLAVKLGKDFDLGAQHEHAEALLDRGGDVRREQHDEFAARAQQRARLRSVPMQPCWSAPPLRAP